MVLENIDPIIKYMQARCKAWESYKLSRLGRVAVVKMVFLPKLIFVFLYAILDIRM